MMGTLMGVIDNCFLMVCSMVMVTRVRRIISSFIIITLTTRHLVQYCFYSAVEPTTITLINGTPHFTINLSFIHLDYPNRFTAITSHYVIITPPPQSPSVSTHLIVVQHNTPTIYPLI